ncbi:MAG: 2-oxoacid:acceptor oxidoreductase family protein [Cocleimonas sp.]
MTNLIIAGIGGQGINSLTKVLAETLIASNYECQFTIHKGGAQSLGSVYAEFRISTEALPTLGQGIPRGQLDFLIALDPWEAVRHATLSHQQTQLWVETETMPFFMQRGNTPAQTISAKKQLDNSGLSVQWRDYKEQAQQQADTVKMANYFAGLDCLEALTISDKSIFDALFFQLIKKAKRF